MKELTGKKIYLPCDDYESSNFVKYFKDNFNTYGLKKVIATHIHIDGTPSEKWEYDGNVETITKMNGNGDFRTQECVDIKNQCDVVITNPPFSIHKQFIEWIQGSKYLYMAHLGALGMSYVVPLLRSNKMWLGTRYKGSNMINFTDKNGNESIVPCIWLTNLKYDFEKPLVELTCEYSPDKYPKYDNFDAIEVSRSKNIPKDYYGLMGIPISFMDKFNPRQFDFVGRINAWNPDEKNGLYAGSECIYIDKNGIEHITNVPVLNRKAVFARIIIKRHKEESK